MKKILILIITLTTISCNLKNSNSNQKNENSNKAKNEKNVKAKHIKPFKKELPTIGLLMYHGVLQGEVVATSDVFAKLDKDGNQLFNVITMPAHTTQSQ